MLLPSVLIIAHRNDCTQAATAVQPVGYRFAQCHVEIEASIGIAACNGKESGAIFKTASDRDIDRAVAQRFEFLIRACWK
ncbi:MAG TPA: hypothetical protein VGK97_07350 [Spongiibacteraceae bacterium]|jgi:hypothetical protein